MRYTILEKTARVWAVSYAKPESEAHAEAALLAAKQLARDEDSDVYIQQVFPQDMTMLIALYRASPEGPRVGAVS